MKIKYSIILCGLAVAFAAVSLWVILSGGRNSRALKTKFRLGGLMLTVSGMIACSEGAGPMQVSCYDVQAPEYAAFNMPGGSNKVKAGDEIGITITGSGFVPFKYKMFVNDMKDILQEGELGDKEGTYTVKVAGTDFKGPAVFCVYGVRNESDEILGGCDFVIE